MTDWQSLDTAPKDKPILLFLPNPSGARPPVNEDVVGYWDDPSGAWVTSAFQASGQPVYPSRWTELPEDPT